MDEYSLQITPGEVLRNETYTTLGSNKITGKIYETFKGTPVLIRDPKGTTEKFAGGSFSLAASVRPSTCGQQPMGYLDGVS